MLRNVVAFFWTNKGDHLTYALMIYAKNSKYNKYLLKKLNF